jgi:hypothetical protein
MAARDVADGAEPLIIQEGNEPTRKVKPKRKPKGYSPTDEPGLGILPEGALNVGHQDEPPIRVRD